jgi:uncharacterized protein YigE (DUF2233 family)
MVLTLICSKSQYKVDTAFHWNGNSYSVFMATIDSFLLRNVSIVENLKGRSEDTLFLDYKSKGDYFAVTASIVDGKCMPLGLYVTSGITKKKLNLNAGSGNFYELTNGIIAFGSNTVFVSNARAYKKDSSHRWALQTGPMLVDSSKVNPQLRKESVNRQYRIGVGLSQLGGIQTLIFVRSNEPINFHHIASLFLEQYKCTSALCLESGPISSIRLPGMPKGQNQGNASCIYICMKL